MRLQPVVQLIAISHPLQNVYEKYVFLLQFIIKTYTYINPPNFILARHLVAKLLVVNFVCKTDVSFSSSRFQNNKIHFHIECTWCKRKKRKKTVSLFPHFLFLFSLSLYFDFRWMDSAACSMFIYMPNR